MTLSGEMSPEQKAWAEELVREGEQERAEVKLEKELAYKERMETTAEKPAAEKQLIILDLSTKKSNPEERVCAAAKSITLADSRIGSNNSIALCPAVDDVELPRNYDNIAGVIFSGSAANIEDKADRPWIEVVEEYMKDLIEHDIPVMGICFGMQLYADAEGKKVQRNLGGTEKGVWRTSVFMDGEMANNPFFKGMALKKDATGENASMVISTLGFHNFRVDASPGQQGYSYPSTEYYNPESTVEAEPYPMFQINKNFYGVQFHPEIDTELGVRTTLAARKASALKLLAEGEDVEKMVSNLEQYLEQIKSGENNAERSHLLLGNFLDICGVA